MPKFGILALASVISLTIGITLCITYGTIQCLPCGWFRIVALAALILGWLFFIGQVMQNRKSHDSPVTTEVAKDGEKK
jgi:membrane-bound ClpP family serine protease